MPLSLQVADGPLLFLIALHCVGITETDRHLPVERCCRLHWILSLSFSVSYPRSLRVSLVHKGFIFFPEVS